AHGGRDEDAGHQRGMVEGNPEAPRAGRGPLRRAGHGGVQPRARRAPREGHPELPLRAGRAGRAHLDHLVRRGKAAVLRAQRGVLGEEPPRPFDGQATVKMGGPEMAPHTPRCSERPGEPGALLYIPLYTAAHDIAAHVPLEPNPPEPRALSGSVCTSMSSTCSTRCTTSCAMRSPRASVTGWAGAGLTGTT